jgi:O-antigen/teichoic acid export membrane protein
MANREIKFLLKHSSIYGIGTIVGQAVGFILLPLYTRYLTPTDYGVATLIDITMGLAGVAAGSGIANAMPRFYYDRQDDEGRNLVISTLYTIIGLFGIAVSVSLLACSGLLSNMLFHSSAYRIHFRLATMSLALGFFVDTGLLYLRVKNESKPSLFHLRVFFS